MKLVGLRMIDLEQVNVPNNDPSILCDYIIITTPEQGDVTVYNLDQIFTVEPTSVFEKTFIASGRISNTSGEKYNYMIIEFMNGEKIKVEGTLDTLRR